MERFDNSHGEYKSREEYEASDEYRKRVRKGFYSGRMISQNEPHMFPYILANAKQADDPFVKGMREAKKKYERNKVLEQLRQYREQKAKERDKER